LASFSFFTVDRGLAQGSQVFEWGVPCAYCQTVQTLALKPWKVKRVDSSQMP